MRWKISCTGVDWPVDIEVGEDTYKLDVDEAERVIQGLKDAVAFSTSSTPQFSVIVEVD